MGSLVAPHRNRELQLVLSGDKPLGSVEKSKDPEQFAKVCRMWVDDKVAGHFHGEEEIVFTLPEHAERLTLWQLVMNQGTDLLGGTTYQWVMGKLYGYTDEEIESFINNEFDCDCSKCKGAR